MIVMAYRSTKERTNYARLCRAIIDVSTEVLRESLHTLVMPANLMGDIQRCKDLSGRALDAHQLNLVRNVINKGSYSDFDITLLYKLLRNLSTQEIRNELIKQIPPNQILHRVQHILLMNNRQIQVLQQTSANGNYDNIDASFGNKILQSIFPCFVATIQPPSDGWGKSNIPSPYFTTFGDDIERIRIIRNTVYGHISETAISDSTFKCHWKMLEDVLSRMDGRLNSNFRQDLATIETMCMDDETENKYITIINELAAQDLEVKEELKRVCEDVSMAKQEWQNVSSTVTGITNNVQQIGTRVGNIEEQVEIRDSELAAFARQVGSRVTYVEQEVRHVQGDVEYLLGLQQTVHAQNIIANTLLQIRLHKQNKSFVRTRAIKQGFDIFKRLDAVIFTGKGGSGKTTAAIDVMTWAMESNQAGTVFLNLGNISEWDHVINAGLKYTVMLDDPIGKTNTDVEFMNRNEKYWDKIDAHVRSGNVKLVIAIRKNILEECWWKLQKYYVFSREHVIDFSDERFKLENSERYQIFRSNCQNNDIEYCENSREENYVDSNDQTKVKLHCSTIDQIVSSDSPIGFPELCNVFCKDRWNTSMGSDFFLGRLQSLVRKLDELRRSKNGINRTQYCILVYILIFHRNIQVDSINNKIMERIATTVDLTYANGRKEKEVKKLFRKQTKLENITNGNLMAAIQILRTEKYIMHYERGYIFEHEHTLEAVAISCYKTNPELLINVSDKGFIIDFIRTECYRANDFELVITVKQTDYAYLAQRFISELQQRGKLHNDRYWWVEHQSMSDQDFVRYFMKTVKTSMKYKKIVINEYRVIDGIKCELDGKCRHKKSPYTDQFFNMCARLWLDDK